MSEERRKGRENRHKRVRRKVFGTPERPRLSVYRSLNNIYTQIIDDSEGKTLVSASSLCEEFNDIKHHRGNIKMAKSVGELIARRAMDKGIKKIVFDKGGYLYHGRIKTLAEAAREVGLKF